MDPQFPRQTSEGIVLHYAGPNPLKSTCIIEGTLWQLETPDEYMQRYSDLVRDGRKQELTEAFTGETLLGARDLHLEVR